LLFIFRWWDMTMERNKEYMKTTALALALRSSSSLWSCGR
jgi:hypothetical protein